MTTDATPPRGSPPLPPVDHFTASDGYESAYRLWRPVAPVRGLVVALHGIQSHSGWYGWSSARLAEAGYIVAFLDRRGSGANARDRGDAPHADRLVNDVIQFVAHLGRRGCGDVPRVLSAVSWGGKLAAAVAIRRPGLFRGLALLAPGISARVRPNTIQRFAVRSAAPLAAGRRTVRIPLDDPALFTDGPEFKNYLRADLLALRWATVRFLAASLALDRTVRDRAAAIRDPVLLLLAGRDRIVDNTATRAWLTTLGTREITVREYPAARHTLEFEPNREEIFADLTDWLGRVMPA